MSSADENSYSNISGAEPTHWWGGEDFLQFGRKWIDAGHDVVALCLRRDGRKVHEFRYREFF